MGRTVHDWFAEARADYELAKTAKQLGSRLQRSATYGVDADWSIRNQFDFLQMISFCRDLERNDPLISQAVRRLVSNVQVGGMQPAPDTGEEAVDEHLKARWKDFASNPSKCDATGRMTFETLANVAFRRMIIDGDCFGVPRNDSEALLMLEAHRCQTPTSSKIDRGVCGIQVDESGHPVTYYLTKRTLPLGGPVKVGDVEPVAAFSRDGFPNVFHIARPQSFSLTRGITALAPVASNSSRRADLEFATILKAQVASCTTFIESEDATAGNRPPVYDGDSIDGGYTYEVDPAGFEMRIASLQPGRVIPCRSGKKLEMQTPEIPGDGQLKLNELLIQYLACNLDLPMIVLLLDARGANFSSYRNVLDQARLCYAEIQRWFAPQFHAKAWQNCIRVWAKSDEILRSYLMRENVRSLRESRLMRCDWMPQGWSYMHPVDDAQGDILLLSNSMQAWRQYTAKKYGTDPRTFFKAVVSDNKALILEAIKAAQEIETATGVAVDWQMLAPMPNRQGLSLQLQDQPGNPPEPAPVEGAPV